MIAYLKVIPGLYDAVMQLFECETIEQQRELYRTRIEHKLFNPLLMWLLSRKLTLALLNGVPKAQRDLLADESGSETIAHFIKSSVEYVMTELPMRDNYFWRVYLTGRYTRDCCPEYLTPSGFQALKDGAADRVSVHTMYVTEFLQSDPEAEGDITRFFLLDHLDWMAQAPKLLEEEWRAILHRACPHRARFLWRSASLKAEFVGDTPVEYMGKTVPLREALEYRPDLAEAGHKVDRVHTYTSFFVADLK
jgi:S-adenosylmethionine-diacylglycerol 3-amino-3-carboxypropyl transferase